jgi:hypothetical protein
MGAALAFSYEFDHVICASCSMPFAPLNDFVQRRRVDGKDFYCPAGHVNVFTKTDLEKLREENRRLAEQVEVERRRRELERSTADSRIRGLKIQKGKVEARLRRTETRVRAGVCPHCNRTFQQLARHMQAKHPDVAACSHATQED